MPPSKPLNVILLGIDSLRADHLSSYGYNRLTTPHLDRLATQGVLFERNYSAHVPTTSAYASMLSGKDCFSTTVVALRHKGGLPDHVETLPEILKTQGYNTSCVGFSGNPSSRGFDQYLDYPSWGSWAEGRSPKAEKLNDVALPELERLASQKDPFFLFLRHMDPHAPYLPPGPFERMFYSGDEFDSSNRSMEPVWGFKPFCDFFADWMPPGLTDADYVTAQYDGAVAYMDAAIQRILTRVDELGLADNTLIVVNGDHGETLYEHECWFDHHGMYDNVLHVPLILRLPGKLPAGQRVSGYSLHQDLVPTILELAGLKRKVKIDFDGQSLLPLVAGKRVSNYSDFYITECTWMRKHGWRTPEWKLMVALEPDFHFKPEVELYNLVEDPEENRNLAKREPGIVAMLRQRMDAHVQRRERETGRTNPMFTNLNWHGSSHEGPFGSSQEAYDTMHIGSVGAANKLQAGSKSKTKKKTRKR
ncbi:MAG: sulfatase [Gemmatimonadetes bacterium]|jgi:arylsulfatase A-like enzyme|nr:sulfatase [Gemmatimonadota bacterium]MBT4609007.1 sulfatase [Gemmatimonadota bacterium]MBT5055814.1 sulfatase [Gemmatimonadota bacterium]MBT5143729.1 sulfatase [Gemmatimonadota bacterium]MBT5590496.1 sulfatase [Gemmatimonadota bacterium]